RNIIIILCRKIIIHRTAESFVWRWKIFSLESIVIGSIVHARMNFHWSVEIIKAFKFSKMTDEFQTDFIQTTVTVLGNNEFCLASSGRVFFVIPFVNFVIFGSINKRNNVRILLDCSRFPKVGKQWTLASATRFNCPRKL